MIGARIGTTTRCGDRAGTITVRFSSYRTALADINTGALRIHEFETVGCRLVPFSPNDAGSKRKAEARSGGAEHMGMQPGLLAAVNHLAVDHNRTADNYRDGNPKSDPRHYRTLEVTALTRRNRSRRCRGGFRLTVIIGFA
jgi:hypothetical protein